MDEQVGSFKARVGNRIFCRTNYDPISLTVHALTGDVVIPIFYFVQADKLSIQKPQGVHNIDDHCRHVADKHSYNQEFA